MKKYLIDGCFDGYHYGHVYSIFQARQLCDMLICGTHLDEEISLYKSKTIFNYDERYFMLKYCKYIDKLESNLPYYTNIKIINELDCTKFCHGYEKLELNNNNLLISYPRTRGWQLLFIYLYIFINIYKYNIKLI